MRKARAEYRIPGFYLINAVCHAAKTKLKGDSKDQYVNRFMEKGMPGFESLSACDDAEKKQIAKVLVFWVDENIFPEVFVRKVAKAIGIQLELKDDGPSIQEQLEKRKAEEEAAEAAAAAAAANPPPPQQMDPRRAVDPRGADPRAQHQLLDVPPGIAQRGPPGWALPQGIMPVSMGPPQGDMGRHDPRGGPSPPGAPPQQQYGQPPPPQPNPAPPPGSTGPVGADDQFYDDDDDDDEARREKQRKLMEAQSEQASRGGPGQYLPPPVMSQIQQQQQLVMQQQIEAAKQNKLMQQQRGQPPPPGGGPGGMQQQGGFGQRQHAMASKDYVKTRKVGPGQRFEEVRIPNSSVGLIIGKQGSTIKNLQAQSGAFVQTQRDAECAPGSTEREVYLVGNDQQLTIAKQMIQEIVDNDPQVNGSAPPRGGGPQYQQQFEQIPPTSQQGDPGNWVCPSCGNENWPKRTACNRCQAQKPFEMEGPPPGPPVSQSGGGPPQLVEMPYVDGMPLRQLPDKPTAGPAPAAGSNTGSGASSPPAKRSKWS